MFLYIRPGTLYPVHVFCTAPQGCGRMHLLPAAVFFFTVSAAVDLFFLVGENENLIQPLLDGGDAARIFTTEYIGDLFRKPEQLLFHDLIILNDIHCDIVINKPKDIKIHKVDGAFYFYNIFFSHFAAFRIFYDGDTAVQFIQMQVFVDFHTFSCLNVI